MNCTVNGNAIEFEGELTLSTLLKDRELNAAAVVIELNREIVDRGAFDTTTITEGAEVEILSFVGGGLCE